MKIRAAAIAFLIAGCASLPTGASDQSADLVPPASWGAGINFTLSADRGSPPFPYSTRVEFNDGKRTRVVTEADVFQRPEETPRTSWYRVNPATTPTVLHVTLSRTGSPTVSVDYPLVVQQDRFYTVSAGIGTNRYGLGVPPVTTNARGYALPPGFSPLATDSIWISYSTRERSCFACPQS